MSDGILKKCHGLPLAIITVASLLAGKSTYQWQQVYNYISSTFSHEGTVRDILLLSYYDLPHYLKTCLLYLSMFPEDYNIDTEELIWRWIAEGFIAEVRGQTSYQVAETYFNELVNRSLIQPVDIQYDGRITSCRVHDMVLEIIVLLSAEENFANIAEEQKYYGSGLKIRRLSVQSEHLGDKLIQEIMDKWSQIRSISFYRFQGQGIPHLEKLHSLRVLIFDYGCHLRNQHIKYIGSFFQLTFLGINSEGITELPDDIGDLRYLQTLDTRGSGIKSLPTTISRLQNLMRLLIDDVELPDKIGDLQTLQELSRAQNYSIKYLEELGRLTRLKTVGIYMAGDREQFGCEVGRYKEALKLSLAAMGEHGLQSLEIFNTEIVQELMDILCCTVPCLRKLDIFGYRINNSLPKQMASFANLTHLGLLLTRIKQEDLYILGELPSLLYTSLSVDHSPGERLTFSSQHFRCLKEFEFLTYACGGGLEMLFLQEAMPELRRLLLVFRAEETESKTGFEFCFKHLASLEHIEVGIRRDNATRSRMEAAEAAVRNAVSIHPGCPILDLSFFAPEDKDERDDRSEHGTDEEELLEEQS
ncbi:unnamed protein product [Urochloa humidicola]